MPPALAWDQVKKLLRFVVFLSLVLVVAGGFFVFDGFGIRVAPSSQATTGDRVNGLIVAHDVLVSAKIDGRLEKLSVDEGSVVRKDDVIAVVAVEEAAAEIRDHQAGIDQYQTRLARGKENVAYEVERSDAQIQRSTAQLAAAESELRQAVQQLDQQRRDAERARQLWEANIISRQDSERARNGVETAEAGVRALQDKVQSARADLELARTARRQVSLAVREVDAIASELQQAQARMARLRTRIGYSQVLAPISGVVSVRVAAEGEIVKAGAPIVSVVDLDDIWVKASFEEAYVSQLQLGQELPIELVSGETLRGKVVQIAPESDFATQRDVSRTKRDIRTFGIKVRLDNTSRRLHPGMTAFVILPPLPAKGGAPRRSPRTES